MRSLLTAGFFGLAALTAGPALAKDRPPTPQERTAIEAALKAAGYVSWEEIEFDDDRPARQPVWDIDDARTADGKAFDLKLEPGSLKILRRTAD